MTTCQHCLYRSVTRPRDLCYACHADYAVRNLYPVKFTHQGNGKPGDGRVLPPVATESRPGTEQRIAVYAERASKGHSLYHPQDA